MNEDLKNIYRQHLNFMIQKDIQALDHQLEADFTLTHMSGMVQTKKEWLREIETEEMLYLAAEIEDIFVEETPEGIFVTGSSRVDARIWGGRNTWRLQLRLKVEKVRDRWKIINIVARSY